MTNIHSDLRAAFATIIQSDSTPTIEHVMLLGKELNRWRLFGFIDEAVLGNESSKSFLRGILSAATRFYDDRLGAESHTRVYDEGHVWNLLIQIRQGNSWLYVRDELVKFAKAVDAELDARTPSAQSTKAVPSRSGGRYPERDTEVVRLKKEKPKRTAGQIAKLILANPDWATMENGKPFSSTAVRAILDRARKSGNLNS